MKSTSTTRRRFAALAGSAVLTGTAGCVGSADEAPADTDDPANEASPTPTGTEAVTATGGDQTDDAAVVEMVTDNEGTYFDPKGLLVDPGTTVRFLNASGSHGTSAYHPANEDRPLRIPEGAEPWASDLFTEPERGFEVTLAVAGVYDYYCPPHEVTGMVGRIVVGEPQGGPATSAPEDIPPGAGEALPAVDDVLEAGTVAGP